MVILVERRHYDLGMCGGRLRSVILKSRMPPNTNDRAARRPAPGYRPVGEMTHTMIASFGNSPLTTRVKFPKLAIMYGRHRRVAGSVGVPRGLVERVGGVSGLDGHCGHCALVVERHLIAFSVRAAVGGLVRDAGPPRTPARACRSELTAREPLIVTICRAM